MTRRRAWPPASLSQKFRGGLAAVATAMFAWFVAVAPPGSVSATGTPVELPPRRRAKTSRWPEMRSLSKRSAGDAALTTRGSTSPPSVVVSWMWSGPVSWFVPARVGKTVAVIHPCPFDASTAVPICVR